MNKFSLNRWNVAVGLIRLTIFATILYISSDLTHTPRIMSFVLATTLLLFPVLYLFFIEKREIVLEKYLASSIIVFLGMNFMSLTAYYDYSVLGIS